MSHTWKCGETTFISNGDLSGEVTIRNEENGCFVVVPGGDLVAFVAEHVRNLRIAELENPPGQPEVVTDMAGLRDLLDGRFWNRHPAPFAKTPRGRDRREGRRLKLNQRRELCSKNRPDESPTWRHSHCSSWRW